MPIERTKKLTIMVSDGERAALKHLADADGISSSDWVRALIRQAPPPPKSKKARR